MEGRVEDVKKDFDMMSLILEKLQLVDDRFKRQVVQDIINNLDENNTAKWQNLDPMTRVALRALGMEKEEITLADVSYLLDLILSGNKNGENGSVSSRAGGTPTPPYDSGGKISTASTGFHFENKASTGFHFESGNEWKKNSQIHQEWKEFDIQVMLIATRRVLYRILESMGKNTKEAERIGLRLALIYLLQHSNASEEEIKRGVGELAEEHDIRTRFKSLDKVLSALRNLPGVKVSVDSLNIRHYELSDKLKSEILQEYNLLKQAEENAQKYASSSDPEEMMVAFMNFFRDYTDDKGKHVYLDELSRLLTEGGPGLFVDWYELNSLSPSLAEKVLHEPEWAIGWAEEAIRAILKEDFFQENPPKIHVRFVNLPTTLSPKQIQSRHLGRLIQIKGIITAIAEGQRTDGRSGFIEKAVFVCKDCGNEMIRLQRPYEPFVAPDKCDACGSRNIELSLEKSRVIDKREVFVQDSEDAMRATTMPSYIRVILLDDLARMRLEPGDEVLMSIILRGVRKSSKDNSLAWVGEAVSVIKLTKDAEDIEITPQDEQKFREMAKDPDFEEKFIESIAPTVVGKDAKRLKKAVAWGLFSGDDEVVENLHIRNRAHILAYGPPSTAKTTIVKYATELAPRHYWVSAPTTSGAGLTAALDSMDGKRVLKAGALVIASGGVAGVNELDKMKDEEYDRLLDAMEEGQFTYTKAGFATTLTAMTRLFATANPPGGEFNKNKTPIEELYQQFPRPLISRFDVIVIVREAKDLREREAIADAIYQRRKKNIKPPYPTELLTKYIAFAHREIKEVDIPEEVWKVAKEYLLKITRNAPTAMPRMIEAFLRLMAARARMHLRDRVTIQDFIAVRDFYTEMLQLLLGTDSEEMMSELLAKFGGITWTEKEKEIVDKLLNIIRYYEQVSDEGALLDDIINEAKQLGIDRDDVVRLLEDMMREKLIESPKPGRYVTKTRGG